MAAAENPSPMEPFRVAFKVVNTLPAWGQGPVTHVHVCIANHEGHQRKNTTSDLRGGLIMVAFHICACLLLLTDECILLELPLSVPPRIPLRFQDARLGKTRGFDLEARLDHVVVCASQTDANNREQGLVGEDVKNFACQTATA